LEHSRTVNPAINGWAIFRGSGATAKTATGTGALPGKDPAAAKGNNVECAGRAGAATALSGGRETFVMRKISVRAKAGSRCACPRSPKSAGKKRACRRGGRSYSGNSYENPSWKTES
jgi:hypothetical protein